MIFSSEIYFTFSGLLDLFACLTSFLTMVMTSFVIFVLLVMGILKFFKGHVKTRLMIKRIFRQADIIKEESCGLVDLLLFHLLFYSYSPTTLAVLI